MGVMKWHQMKEWEKEDEKAREDKIKKHLQNPEWQTEEIFELSNVMCEGGCEEYMTVEDEEAGWGMCKSCKFEEMD
jgi:hypothetical protein